MDKKTAIARAIELQNEHTAIVKSTQARLVTLDEEMRAVAANAADELAKITGKVELLMELYDLTEADLMLAEINEDECAGCDGGCTCTQEEAPQLALA